MIIVITVNQPKTKNEATPQNAPKKFLFFNAVNPPIAARMVTIAKIIYHSHEIDPPLFKYYRLVPAISLKESYVLFIMYIRFLFYIFFTHLSRVNQNSQIIYGSGKTALVIV